MNGRDASEKARLQKVAAQTQLRGKMRAFFSWLANVVSPSAKKIEPEVDLEREKRKRLLSQYPLGELVSGGERSIVRLEDARKHFLEKAGTAGEAFASRHVDPVILSLKNFVLSLKGGAEPSGARVKNILGTVELVALARDEHRPWKKIRESTELQARQALLEDIAFLMAYPVELLSSLGIVGPELAATLRAIEEGLQPILLKSEKLLLKHPISDDFYALFSWRSTLDHERQHLHDMAIKCVEENVAPFKLKFSVENDSFYWQGQALDTLAFSQLYEVFQYLFDLVKSSELFRSDERVLEFFGRCKQHLHSLLIVERPSEEERMRIFQTVRLIEELVGTGDEI